MVIDTSAVIAILRLEAEAKAFADAIAATSLRLMSAVTMQESCMVLAGRTGGAECWVGLEELIERAAIQIAPYDDAQARMAREAFLHYGKGRHPAALNFGDCASYALARVRRMPLLFKGEDFARTDIDRAIA